MENKQSVQATIASHIEGIIKVINDMENTPDKPVILKDLWLKIHRLSDSILQNNNYVSKELAIRLFTQHNKYNDYISLVEDGSGYWKAMVFGIPICTINFPKKGVVFYSEDSMDAEISRLENTWLDSLKKCQKEIHAIDNILGKSDWELFLRDLKGRHFLTPSMIRKGRKTLMEKKKYLQSKMDENKYEEVHLLKKEFLGFLMEISSYLHKAFETESFSNQFKDIEPYCYYFGDAISLFKDKESFVGQSLFVSEDESYWKREKLLLDKK